MFKPTKSQAREERLVKRYQFTITPISDIGKWREEQTKLEATWHAGQEARYARVRQAAMAIVSGDKQAEAMAVAEKLESEYIDSRKTAKKPSKITWEQIEKYRDWDKKNQNVVSFEVDAEPKSKFMDTVKSVYKRLFVKKA